MLEQGGTRRHICLPTVEMQIDAQAMIRVTTLELTGVVLFFACAAVNVYQILSAFAGQIWLTARSAFVRFPASNL